MDYSSIFVSGVTNISWVGEEACAVDTVRCIIYIAACIHASVEYGDYMQLGTIAIQNAEAVHLAFLTFTKMQQVNISCSQTELHDESDTLFPMMLNNVSNAEIVSTTITADSSCRNEVDEALELHISDPHGEWLIDQSVLATVSMDIMICSPPLVGCMYNFSVNIVSSTFYKLHMYLERDTSASIGNISSAVSIMILQCTISGLSADLQNYPASNFRFLVMQSNLTQILYSIPVVSMPETEYAAGLPSVFILLWNVNMQHYDQKSCQEVKLQLDVWYRDESIGGISRLLLPNITISHLNIQDGYFHFLVRGPCQGMKGKQKGCNATIHFPLLTIHNCHFKHLEPTQPIANIPSILLERKAIIYIIDAGQYLVTLSGTNKISHNLGSGIVIKNSHVHNDGYTEICSNNGGIILYSDSQLLLSNNSVYTPSVR